eukprot:1925102-Pleurochrysis_carterae.AAC.1
MSVEAFPTLPERCALEAGDVAALCDSLGCEDTDTEALAATTPDDCSLGVPGDNWIGCLAWCLTTACGQMRAIGCVPLGTCGQMRTGGCVQVVAFGRMRATCCVRADACNWMSAGGCMRARN